jgi:hypothetical protein
MLPKYLVEGYEKFLSDDLATGSVDTASLAEDFLTCRMSVEKSNSRLNTKAATDSEDDSQSHYSHYSIASLDSWTLNPMLDMVSMVESSWLETRMTMRRCFDSP